MKRIKIISGFFAALVLGILFSGCSEEFFDVPVGDRITPEEHYKSIEDAGVSMMGALLSLQDVAQSLILVDGLRSDQMVTNDWADMHLRDINDLNLSADNPFIDNSALYRTIINVNETLGLIDEAADIDREFTSDQLQDMRATLYGLRAWCYLNLARNYGKVTWIDNNMKELPGVGEELPVLSKATIIDTLINQFHRDSVIFDRAVSSSSRAENVYIWFPNYKAVLGELYLEKDDFENAAYYLKLGLETVDTRAEQFDDGQDYVYKVSIYTELAWESIFLNAENRLLENMCVIPYSENNNQPNEMLSYFLPGISYMIKPAQHLVDSMEMAIQSRGDTSDLYRGMGITYDTITSGDYFIRKYAIDVEKPFSSDIILQRSADVHLLLAEALNRSGRSDVALMLLNSGIANEKSSDRPADFSDFSKNQGIRGRVLLAPREVSDTIPETERIELIEEYIIQEKAMECAFEGKRMSDLIRVAMRRDNPGEFIGNTIARKHSDPVLQEMVKNYYMNESNWYLPSN